MLNCYDSAPSTHLVLQLLGLFLRLKRDESVALRRTAAVGYYLGGADVAVIGKELVQVGLCGCVADAAHEDPVGNERSVLDVAAGTAAVENRVGVRVACNAMLGRFR